MRKTIIPCLDSTHRKSLPHCTGIYTWKSYSNELVEKEGLKGPSIFIFNFLYISRSSAYFFTILTVTYRSLHLIQIPKKCYFQSSETLFSGTLHIIKSAGYTHCRFWTHSRTPDLSSLMQLEVHKTLRVTENPLEVYKGHKSAPLMLLGASDRSR